MEDLIFEGVRHIYASLDNFAFQLGGRQLRAYQRKVAQAILDSVLHQRGLEIVVIFPRQSGKNELQAHLEAYLLSLFQAYPAELIKISPTWKPQAIHAMRRLERVLQSNLLTQKRYVKESGHIFRLGQARITFLSGAATSNVVGATANVLLECDEAQDILIEKWDRDFAPMAAATNATRVFYGTAWTAETLLGRARRTAMQSQKLDGFQRVFMLTADEVAQEVPAYGRFVAEQVQRLGRNHPMIRSQYYSEEINVNGGMFSDQRLQLMHGNHPAQTEPQAAAIYVFCLDVGGYAMLTATETAENKREDADASALTIFQIELNQEDTSFANNRLYRVVWRALWQGVGQQELYSKVVSLAEFWDPHYLVVDASGIGAGLAEHLKRKLGRRVIPFIFTQKSKSKLGWDFLALVESGKYKEYVSEDRQLCQLQELFFRQAQYCQMQVGAGLEHPLHWGVPQGDRDPQTNRLLHDDLLISAALCAVLEEMPLGEAASAIIRADDPLGWCKEVI